MRFSNASLFTFSLFIMLTTSMSSQATADGMPFEEASPATPLDKALDEIQAKDPIPTPEQQDPQPAPVSLTEQPAENVPEVKAEPPRPVIEDAKKPEEQPEPPALKAAPAPAQRVVEVQPDASFFGLSVGMYNPFSDNNKSMSFQAEYQSGVRIAGVLQPIFGAMATTDGGLLGYGGLGLPIKVGERVLLLPSAAVGAYREGAGEDLDQTLVYRLGTELAYVFDNKSRIGLNAHVITNGRSFDDSDRAEVISLVYTVPLGLAKSYAQTLAP